METRDVDRRVNDLRDTSVGTQDARSHSFRIGDEVVWLAGGPHVPLAKAADKVWKQKAFCSTHPFASGVVIEAPGPAHGRMAIANMDSVAIGPYPFGISRG